jgi:hypothetical protein
MQMVAGQNHVTNALFFIHPYNKHNKNNDNKPYFVNVVNKYSKQHGMWIE